VHDERIVGWALLGFENAPHRGWIERVRAEPVDRLGRKRDQAAGAQARGRATDRLAIGTAWIDAQDVSRAHSATHITRKS
jgi:hypothetical protein